ncbi:MAG: hypothetical protein ACFFC7_04165 [Candidatus Hermodarchaeota archaeon]
MPSEMISVLTSPMFRREKIGEWVRHSQEKDLVQSLAHILKGFGDRVRPSLYEVSDVADVPLHLVFLAEQLVQENPEASIRDLASISFYSLCKAFLPCIFPGNQAFPLFSINGGSPLNLNQKQDFLIRFLSKDIGIKLPEKISMVLGRAWEKEAKFGARSMLQVIARTYFRTENEIRKNRDIEQYGCLGRAASKFCPHLKVTPLLTANEVLLTLKYLGNTGSIRLRKDLIASLLKRCGKLETFFLTELIIKKLSLGFRESMVIAALEKVFKVNLEIASAIVDPFNIATIITEKGVQGLEEITIRPLIPLKPALCAHASDLKKLSTFPFWVEAKYDGLRIMFHKEGRMFGVYTRGRNDWSDAHVGFRQLAHLLPVQKCILDGELYGTILTAEGTRQCNVYELYRYLMGGQSLPISLKFAVFDILYLEGRSLIKEPWRNRQKYLKQVLNSLLTLPIPTTIQVELAQGSYAKDSKEISALFYRFTNTGYKGVVVKKPDSTYEPGKRTSAWMKKKKLTTIDLVITGVYASSGTIAQRSPFSSVRISVIDPETGELINIGSAAMLGKVLSAQLTQRILTENLLQGEDLKKSSQHDAVGWALQPKIVVSVSFESVVKSSDTRKFALRNPVIHSIRAEEDKTVDELTTLQDIEELFFEQQYG